MEPIFPLTVITLLLIFIWVAVRHFDKKRYQREMEIIQRKLALREKQAKNGDIVESGDRELE